MAGHVGAFFDVDNTIMRGSSAFYFLRGLAARDLVSRRDVADATWKQVKYIVSGSENMEDVARATEGGLAIIAGKREADLREVAQSVYDDLMVNKVWPGTVELARSHVEQGHKVYIVSATPQEVADVLAERMGLTGALGTQAEVAEDGFYTGKLAAPPMHGQAKAVAISKLAIDEGIDLERSWAYSDSSNDIPMLSMVGHPVAINPDGHLRSHSINAGWPIRDYRARSTDAVRVGVPSFAAAMMGFGVGAVVGVWAGRRP